MRGSSLPLAALGLLLALAAWWALSGTAEDPAEVGAPRATAPDRPAPQRGPSAVPTALSVDWLTIEPTSTQRSEVVGEERAADEQGLWLSARLKVPSGAALASSGVRVELLVRHEDGEDLLLVSVYRPTNQNGGMLADLRGFATYNRKRVLEAKQASVVLSRRVAGRLLAATVDVDPRAFVERGIDLGTVRLGEAQLVVAGRVVDTHGRPVSGVAVELRQRSPTAPKGGAGQRAALCPPSTTDSTGAFAIRGNLPDPPFHLELLSGAGIQHRGREFELGATDHELVLARNGWLTVEHVESEAFHKRLQVNAVLESAYPRVVPAELPGDLQPGSRYRLSWSAEGWSTSLPPGTYTLVIQRGSHAPPIVELEHLIVPPGKTCSDPRLVDLDLRDYLWPLDVSVVDRLGQPIPEPRITIWNGDRFESIPRDQEGRIFVATWPCRLVVARDGYVSKELVAEGDVEVQLDDANRKTWLFLPGSFARGRLAGAVWHARVTPLDRGPGSEALTAFAAGTGAGFSTFAHEAESDHAPDQAAAPGGADAREPETDWIELRLTLPGNGRYRVDVALPTPLGAPLPDFDAELLRSFEVELHAEAGEVLLELDAADRRVAEAAWAGS
ncbi:MAG: carboxypeptidase-like regulatory domain-containing protein [Planctomycetota bacterium]|nr:carboxypeptidase-like regulatory domain-containing protein [Planctomycetota bacterium]